MLDGTLVLALCVLVACVLAGAVARAADYYVSPSGDDANPGNQASPWRTIERVNQADLRPGDRVLFEGGKTFPGTVSLTAQDSGLPAEQVVITSYAEGRAVIDAGEKTGLQADGCDFLVVRDIDFVGSGRKNGDNGCGVSLSHSTGSVIDRVAVSGFRIAGVSARGVHGLSITRVHAHDNGSAGISIGDAPWSTDVYIGHCIAENNPGDPLNLTNHSGNGIVAGAVRGCLIEHCEAMNNGWDMPREGNGPVGIWTWNADRVVIQFCISHDNKSPSWDGGGFDLDGGVTNSIMQYNLSYNNAGPGYFMCMYWPAPVWKNNIVRYNISQNDGYKEGQNAGIRVHWMEGMSDAEIYNNTVFNAKGAAVDLSGDQAPGFRFRNNIFVGANELVTGGAHKARFEGNVYWLLNRKTFHVDGHDSLEAWSAATGQERVGDAVVGRWADPRLRGAGLAARTDPAKLETLEQYKLESGSPCVGAGIRITDNGGRDFWGNPVPKKAKPCVGAHQR